MYELKLTVYELKLNVGACKHSLGCLDLLGCRLLELSHSDQLLPFIGWVVVAYGSVRVEGRCILDVASSYM